MRVACVRECEWRQRRTRSRGAGGAWYCSYLRFPCSSITVRSGFPIIWQGQRRDELGGFFGGGAGQVPPTLTCSRACAWCCALCFAPRGARGVSPVVALMQWMAGVKGVQRAAWRSAAGGAAARCGGARCRCAQRRAHRCGGAAVRRWGRGSGAAVRGRGCGAAAGQRGSGRGGRGAAARGGVGRTM